MMIGHDENVAGGVGEAIEADITVNAAMDDEGCLLGILGGEAAGDGVIDGGEHVAEDAVFIGKGRNGKGRNGNGRNGNGRNGKGRNGNGRNGKGWSGGIFVGEPWFEGGGYAFEALGDGVGDVGVAPGSPEAIHELEYSV